MVGKDLGLMGSDRNIAAARIGFLAKPQVQGSDPNSGHGLRAGQQGFLGSDRNFAVTRSGAPAGTAEGWANLGSDPNNPHTLDSN